MIDLDNIKTYIGVITASVGLVVGGYQAADKFGLIQRQILEWSPEHFSVSDGPAHGMFAVTVARHKLRDDCEVTSFRVQVRDADNFVHPATSSASTFSGPATDTIDTFAYRISIDADHHGRVVPGEATLLALIKYQCPEGEVLVQYPDHQNLRFNIEEHQG